MRPSGFGEGQSELIAHQLQVAELQRFVGHLSGFVIDQSHLALAIGGQTVLQTVDSSCQPDGEVVAHAGFRPSADQRAHDGHQLPPVDRIDAVDGVVCGEDVVESEPCVELHFGLGALQGADTEFVVVLLRIIGMVRFHEIGGDVAQCDSRLLIAPQRAESFRGIADGVQIAAHPPVFGGHPLRDRLDVLLVARRGMVPRQIEFRLGGLLRHGVDDRSEVRGRAANAGSGKPVFEHPAHRARPQVVHRRRG